MSDLFAEQIKHISAQFERKNKIIEKERAKIKELEQAQPKWISVEDESPVKGGFYWTTHIKHDKTFSEPVLGRYIDAFRKIESLGNQYFSFTHFMPLFTPQPPKGGDS